MTVKELKAELLKIEAENPNIDEMEIGPIFNGPTLMMTSKIYIVPNGGWDGKDAIGIEWHC